MAGRIPRAHVAYDSCVCDSGCSDPVSAIFHRCTRVPAPIKPNNDVGIRFSGGGVRFDALRSRDAATRIELYESNHFSPRADAHVDPGNLWSISKQWAEDKADPCRNVERNERRTLEASHSILHACAPALIIQLPCSGNIYPSAKDRAGELVSCYRKQRTLRPSTMRGAVLNLCEYWNQIPWMLRERIIKSITLLVVSSVGYDEHNETARTFIPS